MQKIILEGDESMSDKLNKLVAQLTELEIRSKNLINKEYATADVSIHVRFLYDEQVFRFIYKFNGTPYRNKPITPYKGANTLSPFVALADR